MRGWRTKHSRGEFGTVLHVWQYTVCPCCKHEGRHFFTFSKSRFRAASYSAWWYWRYGAGYTWTGQRTQTDKQTKTKDKASMTQALIQIQSYILHQKKYTSQELKRQKERLHMCTRIQRRNTASNRGDKTTWFWELCLYPLRSVSTHFRQGEKWSVELWMVSLFKSQHLLQEKQNKTKKLLARSVLQMQLCIRY